MLTGVLVLFLQKGQRKPSFFLGNRTIKDVTVAKTKISGPFCEEIRKNYRNPPILIPWARRWESRNLTNTNDSLTSVLLEKIGGIKKRTGAHYLRK